MAVNLFGGINWNAFRKGYREGELEDQHDAQFAQDEQLRDLRNQDLLARMREAEQMRPFKLQEAVDRQAMSGLQIEGARRANELGEVAQPGAVAMAGARAGYQGELASRLPLGQMAQTNVDNALLSGQLRTEQVQQALSRLPANQRLYESGVLTQLGGDRVAQAQQGAALQLLPAQTQVAAGELDYNRQLQGYRGDVLAGDRALFPAQQQLRVDNLSNAIAAAANTAQTTTQRAELVDLLRLTTNPDQIRQEAQALGMDPVTFLDQLSARATQMGVVLNVGAGGSVNTDSFTPRTREEAALNRGWMAGRMQPPRPAAAPRGSATQRAAADAANNPLIGAAPAQAAAPAGAPASNLFPSPAQVQANQSTKQAVAAVGQAPAIPDNVAPNDVKKFSQTVDWGNFSHEQLQQIMRAGKGGGYNEMQLIAVGQELHRRAVQRARQGSGQ